jgi:DNA-binding PadR family transcriptional regulator
MSGRSPRGDAVEHVPLKPVVLSILLALAEGPQHGYGVIDRVRERSLGGVLHTGPFYRHLRRLLDEGLVEERAGVPRGVKDDPRRGPYYALTSLGRAVLRVEHERLEEVVRLGRSLGFAGRGGPA